MRIVELDAIGNEIPETVIEIAETTGLLAEDAAIVMFAPEVAAASGFAWASEKIWEFYGDRIKKVVADVPKHVYNRVRDIVTGPGRPRKIAGRKTGKKSKQKRIDFKKKKNRTRNRSPVNAEDEVDQKVDEAENPPPAESQTAIPKMGKWTSYPNTAMCVDLGTMVLDPKGGPNGDYVSSEAVIGEWTKARNMYEWQGVAPVNNRQFQILSEVGRFTLTDLDHNGVVMGTDDQTLGQNHDVHARPEFNRYYRNCSFNSVQTLEEILYNLPFDATNNPIQFVWPVPSGNQYADAWAETNSAFQTIGIKNQYVELHIKNLTGNDLTLSEIQGVDSVTTVQESPLKMEVYILQAKENIYLPISDAATIDNAYNIELRNGFTKVNDRSRSDDPLKPSANNDQNYNIFLGDNGWISDKWKILDKKELCLCPGQEGTLRIGMPKTQILSYQYLLEATKGYLISGTVGTDAYWRFRPVFIKKGEQHVLVNYHGGMGISKNGTDEALAFKPVAAGFLWTHSYEYCALTTMNPQQVVKTTSNTKVAYTDFSSDRNINNSTT